MCLPLYTCFVIQKKTNKQNGLVDTCEMNTHSSIPLKKYPDLSETFKNVESNSPLTSQVYLTLIKLGGTLKYIKLRQSNE